MSTLGYATAVEGVNDSGSGCFSTENLLLNAYRQTCFGLPPMLVVDTTHRLMIASNFCCMLIGTMSVTQHFHIVAFAISV